MPNKMVAMLAISGLACATPAPSGPKRLSASSAGSIKSRAAAAHSGIKTRRAATTAKARRKELEKRPQALDTLRRRKPRPEVKPLPKKEKIRKDRPGWTKNPPPADGTYIFGLGSAAYADEATISPAWTQARDRAYAEVASQLKVQVQARAKDYQAEFTQGGKTRSTSSFSEAVTSHVDASLEGVELHDRFQDKKIVYVLARFNKAELDALLLARLESLKAEVYDRISEARQHLAKRDGVNALAAALRAAVARRNLFGMPVDVDGKQADAVIEGLVREAAGLVRLEGAQGVSGRSGDRFEGIGVSTLNDGQSVSGVPVRFDLVGGTGFVPRVVASQGGRAELGAVRIFGRSPRLRVVVDLATLASVDARENRWLKRQFGREMVSLSRDVDLRLKPRMVRLDGEASENLLDALSRRLGLSVGSPSDWTVTVVVQDFGCKDLSMRRTCTAEGTLKIKDNEGFSMMAKRKVRGTASDDGEATAQIEKRMPGQLIKQLIRNMTGQ